MMAFPSMLVGACEKAGVATPPDANNYIADDFPHFSVFCAVQLCRSMQPGEHWDNAHVIASFSVDEIKHASLADLISKGLRWQS